MLGVWSSTEITCEGHSHCTLGCSSRKDDHRRSDTVDPLGGILTANVHSSSVECSALTVKTSPNGHVFDL